MSGKQDMAKLREALRESEERFRALFNNIIDGLVVIDEHGTIVEIFHVVIPKVAILIGPRPRAIRAAAASGAEAIGSRPAARCRLPGR